MPKNQLIDPDQVRKPGKVEFSPIPLNQYSKSIKDERANFSDDELIRIYHDMFVIREFETMLNQIKANTVCPGNYYEGPMWSDPVNGLFVQYLNTGKVTGAKTVEDVKHYYLSQVPLGKGCSPADVTKAIFYAIDQENETGQAIPVTGGQIMIN